MAVGFDRHHDSEVQHYRSIVVDLLTPGTGSSSLMSFSTVARQVSANVRIAASARGRNWSSALRILQEMQCLRLLPDAYSRNSALDACKASVPGHTSAVFRCWAVAGIL